MGALRDVAVVAGHELSEALRSRRVLILALLYLGGALAATQIFIEVLRGFEDMLAETLVVAHSQRPGALSAAVMRSKQAQALLARLLGDEALVAELISIPPLALFYGWLTVTFCPALVMMTANECIAGELATGAIRFSLVRVDRLSYSAGKLLGQCALTGASIFVGALAVWVTGYVELSDFTPMENGWWLASLAVRGFIYCLSYVGLAVGLSHLTRSVPIARGLGLLGLGMTAILWSLAHFDWRDERLGLLARSLAPLLPQAYMVDLFRPQLAQRLAATVMLCSLGLLYFAAGFRLRMRRDV